MAAHVELSDPDWTKVFENHFGGTLKFKRPLFVAMPCVGIDGCGTALQHMKVPFFGNNVMDLEKRYRPYLEEHLGHDRLHLGHQAGDVTALPLEKVERPVDLLVSGPPCPPWAGNGSHRGADDDRAEVFLAVVRIVISLILCGELKACCLENVKGITNRLKKQPVSFMDCLLQFLQAEVPMFDWSVITLKAKNYLLPQQRTRVFLRGIRYGRVPPPLPSYGQRPLEQFLDDRLPSVDWDTLTECMKENLSSGVEELQAMVSDGVLDSEDIIVFPLDRAPGKVYKRNFSKNIVPTLTTTNKYLFLVTDLHKEEGDRRFFRFLHPSASRSSTVF